MTAAVCRRGGGTICRTFCERQPHDNSGTCRGHKLNNSLPRELRELSPPPPPQFGVQGRAHLLRTQYGDEFVAYCVCLFVFLCVYKSVSALPIFTYAFYIIDSTPRIAIREWNGQS